ncbi:DUF1508 domain-containing protein [Chitinophaga sp. 212800010-3]|uniref:DUF1508 domain-containing protein n=1 Tax=unclassified Chitinophaga TaxID=2619133 RepID=UPI002DF6D852|nr:type II toxin-antitoxin system Y4mF family antitoxin [Chitinophaga sp. 212800010-3]
MGNFVITKRYNGSYQFILKAGNGEHLLSSESFSTKAAVSNGINSVIANSPRKERYESLKASSGQYFFHLKGTNDQVIGVSEMYDTVEGRDRGIQSVMRNAIGAQITDGDTTDGLPATTSQFVREKRRQMRLTQEELAFKAGVGLRFIRELEGGEKDTLRIDKVNQVLKLFGYSLGPVQIARS